jgi:hypothetical protein
MLTLYHKKPPSRKARLLIPAYLTLTAAQVLRAPNAVDTDLRFDA